MKRRHTAVGLVAGGVLLLGACVNQSDGLPAGDGSAEADEVTSSPASPFDEGDAGEVEGGANGSGVSTTGGDDHDDGDDHGADDGDDGLHTPDVGTAGGECDPRAQDCPLEERCTAYAPPYYEAWAKNKCVQITGNGQVGDPCSTEGGKYTGIDNCDRGLICLLADDDGQNGTCIAFCGAQDECEGNTFCVVLNFGSLPICMTACDPLDQDCPAGQGCYPTPNLERFYCLVHTGAALGQGAPGDPCPYLNICQPGTMCMPESSVHDCQSDSGGCCTSFCDLGSSNPSEFCRSAEECFALNRNPVPGYEDVGVCVIPD